MEEHYNGKWVKWEDYARLKAECQARQAENSVLAVECDSLKAEVERLQSIHSIDSIGIEQLKAQVERLANTSTNADRFLISGLEQDVAILKEQVARLTKAEDKMIEMTYMRGIAGINRGVQS
jgi:cell division protein FtsB